MKLRISVLLIAVMVMPSLDPMLGRAGGGEVTVGSQDLRIRKVGAHAYGIELEEVK